MTDFLKLFIERRELCAQLLTLSNHQEALVESEGFDELNVLLANKQRLIGLLSVLETRFPNLKNEWQTGREALPLAQREACDQVLKETEELFARLNRLEQSAGEKLTAYRARIRREIAVVEAGSRAQEAYGSQGSAQREINIGT